MSDFRLVILDYAKNQLADSNVCQGLNDLITVKQMNFERTDPDYVSMDKHDMIGTHFMIYDVKNLFSPKLIFALRVTYEDRSIQHKLTTPLQDLVGKLQPQLQGHYKKFRQEQGSLVDCNAWFVDPNFSLKGSGLRLSDIGYTMVYLHVKRLGYNHIAGCTNERYKASRWLANIGSFDKSFEFVHPVVPDPHMLILVEKFNVDYLRSVYQDNRALFDGTLDLTSAKMTTKSITATAKDAFGGNVIELDSMRVNKAG